MQVSVRNPQFKVLLHTRDNGRITVEQTHGAIVEIQVQRRLGDPAGSFQLTFF